MDALDVLKVCVRRWWVFVPVVALALGAGLGIVRGEKSTYQSYASFALVYDQQPIRRGPQDVDPRLNNPLADNGAALLGEAILAELGTPARQSELGDPAAHGAEPGMDARGTRFAVTLPTNSSSYYVSAWSDDKKAAAQTVEAVLAALPSIAESIQPRAGAPAASQYSAFTTTSPQVAEVPPGSPVKIMIGIFGVGLLAGAALAVLTDFIALRRLARGGHGTSPRTTSRWGPIPPQPVDATPPVASGRDQDQPAEGRSEKGRARKDGRAKDPDRKRPVKDGRDEGHPDRREAGKDGRERGKGRSPKALGAPGASPGDTPSAPAAKRTDQRVVPISDRAAGAQRRDASG